MKLTDEQYSILVKIAKKTGMDCWFKLKTDKRGNTYVYDIENKKRLSWKQAISDLREGIVDYESCDLIPSEIKILKGFIKNEI